MPPSSIEVRSTFCAAWASSVRPTWVEPVKDSLRSRGSASSGSVIAAGREEAITLTTPAGTPTSVSSCANSSVVSGVLAAGLMITGQPAASAGAILRVAMASGKFHGVIRYAGPTGRWETIIRPVPSGLIPYRPPIRTASSLNQRRNSEP